MFTWNNPDQMPELDHFPGASYLLYQEELAPDTGTHHLQGFLTFPTLKSLAQLTAMQQCHYTRVTKGKNFFEEPLTELIFGVFRT